MHLRVIMSLIIFSIQSELQMLSRKSVNRLAGGFPSAFFIYFQLIYRFLDVLRGRQNEELLDRVRSLELYLIFLGMI